MALGIITSFLIPPSRGLWADFGVFSRFLTPPSRGLWADFAVFFNVLLDTTFDDSACFNVFSNLRTPVGEGDFCELLGLQYAKKSLYCMTPLGSSDNSGVFSNWLIPSISGVRGDLGVFSNFRTPAIRGVFCCLGVFVGFSRRRLAGCGERDASRVVPPAGDSPAPLPPNARLCRRLP